jgi:N-dimethylarginine dimethylaminohydrolase
MKRSSDTNNGNNVTVISDLLPPDRYWPGGMNYAAIGNPQMQKSQGLVPDYKKALRDNASMIQMLIDSEENMVVFPPPSADAEKENGLYEDAEFNRDPYFSDPRTGKSFLFFMGEKKRRGEVAFHQRWMTALGIPTERQNHGEANEGGNIRVVHTNDGEQWYVGGVSFRSTRKAHIDLAEQLDIPSCRQVILDVKEGTLHLDCAEMIYVDPQTGVTIAWNPDSFTRKSNRQIEQLLRDLRGQAVHLGRRDATQLTSNQLQPFGSSTVFGGFEMTREDAIRRATPSLRHYRAPQRFRTLNSGGAIHCVSNGVQIPERVTPALVAQKLLETGLFGPGGVLTDGIPYVRINGEVSASDNFFEDLAAAK